MFNSGRTKKIKLNDFNRFYMKTLKYHKIQLTIFKFHKFVSLFDHFKLIMLIYSLTKN